MSRDGSVDVKIPDLGDFKDVAVIDVLVKAGDAVAVDTPLITLETEKATMDMPSPAAGVVAEVTVRTGQRVNSGSVIARLRSTGQATSGPRDSSPRTRPRHTRRLRESEPFGGEPYMDTVPIAPMENAGRPARQSVGPVATGRSADCARARRPAPRGLVRGSYDFDLAVLGAGPGGYTAAFRAADLGLQGRADRALAAARRRVSQRRLHPVEGAAACGEASSKKRHEMARTVSPSASRESTWPGCANGRSASSNRLGWRPAGACQPAKGHGDPGDGQFAGAHELRVAGRGDARTVSFAQCIIAAGSEPVRLPGLPDDPRIIDSTGALELDLPGTLLVIGGGIIGLEMATVYAGARGQGQRRRAHRGSDARVRSRSRQAAREADREPIRERVDGHEASRPSRQAPRGCGSRSPAAAAPKAATYDRVLVSCRAIAERGAHRRRGRRRQAGRARFHPGRPADAHQRQPHIFAIGDIVGAADACSQGDARRQGRRGSRCRAEEQLRCARDSVGRIHRPRGRLGRSHRDRGARKRNGVREGHVSMGGERLARSRSGATRVSPSCCSIRRRTACWEAESSAPMRAT